MYLLSPIVSFCCPSSQASYLQLFVSQSNAAKTGGRSREDVILEIVQDMLNRLPPQFDIELAQYRYPVQYMESMNSVLHQEMTRYNNLTEVVGKKKILIHNKQSF
jgi:dynein heavy chain